jgi:hypothetical protein
MSKPLPPYAKAVADARRRGLTLRNPSVSVRLHWGPRPRCGYGVVVPDESSPADLEWSWARGLEVIIFKQGDSAERVTQAIAAIEPWRPRRLLVVDFIDNRTISVVEPEASQHAAA